MATIKVVASGPVANMVFQREDGHELSLSSMGHGNLIEWNGANVVRDYGDFHTNAEQYLAIVTEFLTVEREDSEPTNVYSRRTHRSA